MLRGYLLSGAALVCGVGCACLFIENAPLRLAVAVLWCLVCLGLGVCIYKRHNAAMQKEQAALIATLAHDMRAPLSAIRGFTGGVMDGTVPTDRLSVVMDETSRLDRMVEDVLFTARLGTAPLNVTDFDITESARIVLISMERAIEEKALKVDFAGEDCVVTADKDLIHRALYNLVENAVKYTPAGGSIGLYVKEGTVTVKNSGTGIAEKDLPHIFDRFYRGDTGKKGTGLGLYTVKAVLNLHGKDIHLENKAGEYCAFSFSLPIAK